ncbi:MAG: rhomboid family intramembrane serine protease [Verrucomicrobiota bacterium]|jgi:membrane associated rhomboid family serine protease
MSSPRRQTSSYQRIWSPGRASGVLVFFWTMIFWGTTQAVLSWSGAGQPLDLLKLDLRHFSEGEYWRLLSYQFLHAGPVHFFANLLVLCYAGREIEPIVGRVNFLWLCLLANATGGAVSMFAGSGAAVVGFSAAVAAVLAAYATIMPELETGFSFLHIFPLRFRAKYLAAAMILFAAGCVVTGTLREIGPAGILTGSVLGWVWARRLGFGNPFWFQRRRFERTQREQRIRRMNSDDFVRMEIDPILEKISRDGIASLTRAERKVLDIGRDKLCSHAQNGG